MIAELALVVAGIAISSISMTIGIGGGLLWTPLLILAYGASPQEAVATSLLIQVMGQGSGALAYLKSKLVEKKLAMMFFMAALPGVIIGSLVTVNLSQATVQMALGIMAMVLAVLFVSSDEGHDSQGQYCFDQKQTMRILPIPGLFGFIMGALSLGISEWLVPALRSRLKLPMNRAIATVIPVMFLLALVASSIHWTLAGSIQLDIFAWGAIGAIIGAQIGARISQYISERLLKETFIYLMTLIGIHLIFQAV